MIGEFLLSIIAGLRANAAVLRAVVVPILLGIIGPLRIRESGGRFYRRVRWLAQLRPLLADDSDAAKRLDGLLEVAIGKLSERHSRKLDGANLAAIIAVSDGGSHLLRTGDLGAGAERGAVRVRFGCHSGSGRCLRSGFICFWANAPR